MFYRPRQSGIGRILLVPAAVLLAAFLGACMTAPPPVVISGGFDALPPELPLYFSLSVPDSRKILEVIVDETGSRGTGSAYFLENSRRAFGGIDIGSGGVRSFSLLSEGDFSPGLVGFGLRSKSDWTEEVFSPETTAIPYFTRTGGGMQISVPEKRYLLAASDGIREALARMYRPARNTGIEETTARELTGASLGLYSPKPGRVLTVLSGLGLGDMVTGIVGIEGIMMVLKTGPEGWALRGRLDLADERDARPLLVLLKIVIAARLAEGGRSFAEIRERLHVVQEGKSIGISGITLTEIEVEKTARGILKTIKGTK